MPDGSGIELARKIRSHFPDTRILIVTMHSKIDYISEAFQAWASGFVVKEFTSERLLHGIEAVLKGDYFLDSSVSQQVVKRLWYSLPYTGKNPLSLGAFTYQNEPFPLWTSYRRTAIQKP